MITCAGVFCTSSPRYGRYIISLRLLCISEANSDGLFLSTGGQTARPFQPGTRAPLSQEFEGPRAQAKPYHGQAPHRMPTHTSIFESNPALFLALDAGCPPSLEPLIQEMRESSLVRQSHL